MIDTLVKQIKNLPSLPASVVKVQDICNQNDVNIKELVKTIESDPMLNVNLIKIANSPLYGMSKEVVSVSHAIMLFGVNIIRGFVAAIAIKKTLPIDLSPYGIGIETLSELSTMQAALARQWYDKIDKQMMQKLQSAALLMEMGKIIAAQELIVLHASKKFHSTLKEKSTITEAERAIFGANSYEIAAMMFETWNFDKELIEILRFVGRSDQAPAAVKSYSRILEIITVAVNIQEPLTQKSVEKALMLVKNYELDAASFILAVEALHKQED